VVLVDGMLEVALPELMSVLLPAAAPAVLPMLESVAVPEAPMDVPLPVSVPVVAPVPLVAPAVVVSVEPGVVAPMLPLAVLVSLGEVVVDGIVVDAEEDSADSSFLLHALRDSAAIRARAAQRAMGDLIIRNSFECGYRFDV